MFKESPRTGKDLNDQLDKLWCATAMPQRPKVWINRIVLREKVRPNGTCGITPLTRWSIKGKAP